MAMKVQNDDGQEVEVYTADEVKTQADAAVATAVAAKETEFSVVKTELEGKLTDAEKRAQERSGEFAQFRKMSDEDKAKLTVAERTIYENGLALAQANEARVVADTAALTERVNGVIKSKAGDNVKLSEKMKEMWPLITIEATTPEQIEAKAQMVLGAISSTVPDLLANVSGFNGGSYLPPQPEKKEGETFADTAAGKGLAGELGLTIESPKKA